LDLRYNGGGSMWEAMQLAGIFIDIGPVASVKEKDGKDNVLKDPNRGTIYDGPIVVLINGASASASEFVSAALQDYNRAIILGSSTYGKGTAQLVVPLDTNTFDNNKTYDDFVKVTMRKFYRINGNTTQWMGVVPDIALPDLFDGAEDAKEKNVQSALKPDMNRALSFRPLPALPISTLAMKSNQRVKANATFQQLINFNTWLKKYNTARTISLQWSSYAAQYNEAIKQYAVIEKEDAKPKTSLINVSNNGFDKQKIQFYNARGKSANQDYLDDIANDDFIIEAYNILMDWNNK
jgi:carboxyl-terminal processing protease